MAVFGVARRGGVLPFLELGAFHIRQAFLAFNSVISFNNTVTSLSSIV